MSARFSRAGRAVSARGVSGAPSSPLHGRLARVPVAGPLAGRAGPARRPRPTGEKVRFERADRHLFGRKAGGVGVFPWFSFQLAKLLFLFPLNRAGTRVLISGAFLLKQTLWFWKGLQFETREGVTPWVSGNERGLPEQAHKSSSSRAPREHTPPAHRGVRERAPGDSPPSLRLQ